MIFSVVLWVFDIIFFIYLAYISSYNLLLSFAGILKARYIKYIDVKHENNILILIPCYKDNHVIVNTARKATDQGYPINKFEVVVIADSLKPETVEALKQLPITVIEVIFEKSTKVRALNKALKQLNSNYEAMVILDADNIMAPDFLRKFNLQLENGDVVIQGQRLPKNENTKIAILDGLSEHINNHILRKGTCNLGMSSSISGSGFGGEFNLLKNTLSEMDSIGGFDKELEILLLQQGVKTKYYQDLIVYDEKVDKPEVFENQRKRWISSQYFYLRRFIGKGFSELLRGNISFFNSTVLRNLQLPRLLNLGLLPFFIIYPLILESEHLISPIWWIILTFGFILSFILALPKEFYSANNLKSLLKLPGMFFIMFKLLFRLKGANTKFIHTPKGANDK